MSGAVPVIGTKPRLGFLGVGWIGRNRLEAVAQDGRADIAAIADPSEDLVNKAAELAPGAALAASLDDLLELDLDGVVIATPSALHAEQSIRALEAGLAVFCQKPLGRHAAEARLVVETARAADRLLGVDLSYRYTAGMQTVRELIQSGELGDIYGVDLTFHNAYGPDKSWFYDRQQSGGGCVIDLGIHLVDLATWVLDFPVVTNTWSRLLREGKPLAENEVEDFAMAGLELSNGAAVQLACSWRLPAGCDAVITASFYGTKGGASFRNIDGSFYDFRVERFHGTQRETLVEPPDDWGGRALLAWAEKLKNNRAFDVEAHHFVQVAEVLDLIYGYRSAT